MSPSSHRSDSSCARDCLAAAVSCWSRAPDTRAASRTPSPSTARSKASSWLSDVRTLGLGGGRQAVDHLRADLDLERALHDGRPAMDEVAPPVLDVKGPMRSLAQRLVQEHELAAVVDLPR